MWCQVTAIDGYILLFEGVGLIGNSSGRSGYLEAITRLNLGMQSDARFRDIRWFRRTGAAGPGARTPLDIGLDELPLPAQKGAWFGRRVSKAGETS